MWQIDRRTRVLALLAAGVAVEVTACFVSYDLTNCDLYPACSSSSAGTGGSSTTHEDGGADGPTDGEADGPTDGEADGPKDAEADGPKDGEVDGDGG
jgi:hypothetical protein